MSSSIRYFFVLLWFWLCLPFRPALLRQAYAKWLIDDATADALYQQAFEALVAGPPKQEEVLAVAPAEAAPSISDERITCHFYGVDGKLRNVRTMLRSKRKDRITQGHGDTFDTYNFYAFVDGNYVYKQQVANV